jgi:stage V sporulation protein R
VIDRPMVDHTAGPEGFKSIRSNLSAAYRLETFMPEISVVRYAHDADRKLVLHHQSYNGRMLVKAQAEQTLKHLRWLWGFDVSLETVDQNGMTVRAY